MPGRAEDPAGGRGKGGSPGGLPLREVLRNEGHYLESPAPSPGWIPFTSRTSVFPRLLPTR